MQKSSKFKMKELVYLLPGLFGLFLMGVVAIPFLLILLFFSQEKGLVPVLIFLAVCLNITLLAIAFFRFRSLVLPTRAKILWLLVITAAPILGPILFLIRAQPVSLHLVGEEKKYNDS